MIFEKFGVCMKVSAACQYKLPCIVLFALVNTNYFHVAIFIQKLTTQCHLQYLQLQLSFRHWVDGFLKQSGYFCLHFLQFLKWKVVQSIHHLSLVFYLFTKDFELSCYSTFKLSFIPAENITVISNDSQSTERPRVLMFML